MSDYIGFTFGEYHSSELGFYRVSDGSRYQRDLSAPTKDITLQVDMGSTYFLEAKSEPRTFSVSIAYDNLTEEQLSLMGRIFNGKEVQPLIFDELPFKAYFARAQRGVSLNYVPFETIHGERVYKGEGTIEFIAYDPLAVSTGKYLSDFPTTRFPNRDEWASASRMKITQQEYDQPGQEILLYNAGDEETDLLIYFPTQDFMNIWRPFITIALFNTDVSLEWEGEDIPDFLGILAADIFDWDSNGGGDGEPDYYIRYNSKNHLLEGCDRQQRPTGNLYNRYIIGGDFFKLPRGEYLLLAEGSWSPFVEYSYRYY